MLAVRVKIYRELAKWELMQVVAKTPAQEEPENPRRWLSWAQATRRAEFVEAARFILVNALEGLDHPRLHYNLACHECQLVSSSAIPGG